MKREKTRLFKVSNCRVIVATLRATSGILSLTLSEGWVRRSTRVCPPTPRRIQEATIPQGETPYLCSTMPCNALFILNAIHSHLPSQSFVILPQTCRIAQLLHISPQRVDLHQDLLPDDLIRLLIHYPCLLLDLFLNLLDLVAYFLKILCILFIC